MPTRFQQTVTRLAASAPTCGTDAGLIAAFLQSGDQDAFAELVRRHGPAVLGVCRRFLGPTPDADDAFQATFLVLVRRARSNAWREALGPWLYGVALKVARKARASRARRWTTNRQVPAMTNDAPAPTAEPDDTAAIVDEELAALPAAFRRPLVMCEIQGLSRRAAARELGIAEGTLSSRLARGRKLLREQLVRRGVAPTVGGLAVAVPTILAAETVRNAVHVLTRAAGAVPAGVLALTEGTVKAMIVQWKLAAVLIAACLGLGGFGAWRGAGGPEAAAASGPSKGAPTVPSPEAAEKSGPPKAVPANQPPEQKPPAPTPKSSGPVATIYGDVPVTREAFADYLIRRYGKTDLEQFVKRQIIAREFAHKGLTLTPDEVNAALDSDIKELGISRDEFVTKVLPRYPLDVWTEDVIAPRLMLARLCKGKEPEVTEAELRQAFDAEYGEKVRCRAITWTKDEGDLARSVYEKVRESDEEFERYARRGSPISPDLVTSGGHIPPIPRALPPNVGEHDEIFSVIARLKLGEVSPLIRMKDGFVVVKCDGVIPADKTKSFEKEKPALLAELAKRKINDGSARLFADLKKQANPKYLLTVPDPLARPSSTTTPRKNPEPTEPVATIYSDVPVTREAFAEYLIHKYGEKDLEPFVNKQIISRAYAQKGWALAPEDLTADLDRTCKSLGIGQDEFVKTVLPRYKLTLEEWTDDVIAPQLMLAHLYKEKMPAVTDEELRQAFESKFGENLQCRVIIWGRDEGKVARKAYETVRDSNEEFDRYARRSVDPNLAAIAGRLAPIPRTPRPGPREEICEIAAKLKPGEVSPLVLTANGWVVVKCDAVIAADKTKSFDKEKPMLLAEVARAKIERGTSTLFKELKQQADPKYHLTVPGKQ
jgi:RNA polymerase sigma factor (sigma-70 family)